MIGKVLGAVGKWSTVLLTLSLSSWVFAAPGELDTEFGGGDGWVAAQLSPAMPEGSAFSLIQSVDGKLVVAGRLADKIALVRFSNEGVLDSMFGVEGIASEQVSVYGSGVNALIEQGDGMLIVGGWAERYGGGNNIDFMLARFGQDGFIDSSFGVNGLVVSPMSGGEEFFVGAHDRINSLVQQDDGKIVAFGDSYKNSAAIVRYNNDGNIDSSLSSVSLVPPFFSRPVSIFRSMDGNFIVTGSAYYDPSQDNDFVFKKLNNEGAVDNSFGNSGVVYVDVRGVGVSKDAMAASIQQKDGSIVAAGISNLGGGTGDNYLGIVKVLSNGSLDASFGSGGRYLSYSISQYWSSVSAMVELSDGSIVVAGMLGNGNNTMVRFTDLGVVDTSFGIAGYVSLSLNDLPFYPLSIVERRDGKLAVAGYVMDSGVSRFVLAVYQTGQPDSDGDGYTDMLDNCPSFFNYDQLNNDRDSVGDDCDTDDDNDSVLDLNDNCIYFENLSQVDTDFDGQGDACDSDDDGDLVVDVNDNCPIISNISQANADVDGLGDACDDDDDGDTIQDLIDNCTLIGNVLQIDTDTDGHGDACDTDDDGDTVMDLSDNCPLAADASQTNTDADSLGDACDDDDDGDGLEDVNDNCSLIINVDQVDTDFDGYGDACDSEDDGDGVEDLIDNCSFVSNESQVDSDIDGLGDACDDDDDGDALEDDSDNCPLISNASQTNTDIDGFGDACDNDDDGDSLEDSDDNCPLKINADQVDSDSDGQGDVCDVDDDGDSFNDVSDNCPLISNPSQVNTDNDSQGDACDLDDDNDYVIDLFDNCPLIANAGQLDWDNDGMGDRCDGPVPMPEDQIGENRKEHSGQSVAFAGDFNRDGYGDYVVGIPGADKRFESGFVKKDIGRAEIISGKNGGLLADMEGYWAKSFFGTSVAGGADINNDGYDDVVIGGPNSVRNPNGVVGQVLIMFGPDGRRRESVTGADKSFGSAVALGDVNGDGYADLLVGAPKESIADDRLNNIGSVTVFSGKGLSRGNGIQLKKFYGNTSQAGAGRSVAAADLNNDGSDDIIIGAPGDDGVGSVKAYTLAGMLLWQKFGEGKKAQFGKALATGDINGDGRADVLVGAPLDDDLVNGLKDTGSITAFSGNWGFLMTKKYGGAAKANLGGSVTVGDLDGDGNAELIAGAWKDDNASMPKTIKDTGSVTVWNGSGYTRIATLYGAAPKDYLGSAVGSGDLNSDGKDDLIIGVPGFDVTANKIVRDAGKVTVLSGAAF